MVHALLHYTYSLTVRFILGYVVCRFVIIIIIIILNNNNNKKSCLMNFDLLHLHDSWMIFYTFAIPS